MSRALHQHRAAGLTIPLLTASLLALAACGPTGGPPQGTGGDRQAPLLEGLGGHRHPISTDVELAQRYFDQGLLLAFAFNHAEAERSFREAARLDPECAMCWWGVALVLGPNINAAMEPGAASPAWEAISRARELAAGKPQRERAYVEALAARYAPRPPEDRSGLDRAWAEAQGELAAADPDDVDAAALYAEALMDLHPWDYWTRDGEPRPWTPEILEVLEDVLEKAPDHPLANHLYIHAVEASPEPERGLASARRLEDAMPGAGHMVHMPSHIYIRTGDYHAGSLANERAIAADLDYITQCHAQGLYPLAYVPHNYHFLWATATMEGRSQTAIEAATEMASRIDPAQMREPGLGTLQHYWITPLYAWVRFARWDEILAAPEPDADLPYPRGVRHFARGLARLGTGDPEAAAAELAALEQVALDPALETVTVWEINSAAQILDIAREVLAGELAAARGDYEEAVERLREAVELEEALNYNEPPDWSQPVRHSLGAVLLEAGRPAEAEAVYLEDLRWNPENGWALAGLAESLRRQGKSEAAAEAEARFAAAWKHADVEVTGSRL